MNAGWLQRIRAGSDRERRWFCWSLGWSCLLLMIDQVSKAAVEHRFSKYQSRPIIDGFFSLTYVTNRGAAWSMLEGQGWLLLLVAAVVFVAALCFLRTLVDGCPERCWAVFTVLSGVLGNSIDRIWRGEVVDFLDFYYRDYHYPVFNIADCAICVGVGVFVLSSLLRSESKKFRLGKMMTFRRTENNK